MGTIKMIKMVREREAFLRQHWAQYRQWAVEAYAQHGRGGFVIDLDSAPSEPLTKPRYLTAAGLKEWRPDAWPWALHIAQYNPERSALFFLCSIEQGEGRPVGIWDRGADLELPPITRDRPDSRAARDFDELLSIIEDIMSRGGKELLSREEAVVWNAMAVQWEVENGGFMQYIENEPARWQPGRLALQTVGATEVLRVYDKVGSLFPDGSPSNDYDQAIAQVESLAADREDPFAPEDSEFDRVVSELKPKVWQWWVSTIEPANRPRPGTSPS
jgi:hypothetical protein